MTWLPVAHAEEPPRDRRLSDECYKALLLLHSDDLAIAMHGECSACDCLCHRSDIRNLTEQARAWERGKRWAQ